MAKSECYASIDVVTSGHQYPVIVCRNGLCDKPLLQSLIRSSQVFIVTNETVAPLYLPKVQAAFSSLQCDVLVLPDGEEYKNQQSLFAVYDALLEKRHHRDTNIIALGGGVIGDLAGFAAATYQRGANFIQIPTTLLAQIDASVGGKTAINHPLGKNMLGSFYQPQAVLIDVETLDTLPEREFKAGLAEMIKYGLLVGGAFFEQLQQVLANGLGARSPQLPQLIASCCRIKAEFVASDEKEKGARALLNLGHTFAHALEAETSYKKWLHGEAVAIGLYCAAVLSYNLGLLDKSLIALIEQMLSHAGLAYKIPRSIDLQALREHMNLDKKIKDNRMRFVVIKQPGTCYLEDKITESCINDTLISVVEGE